MLTELVLNFLVDWLSPLEYDGRAHIKLAENDPRLRIGELLRWELSNALRAGEWISSRVLQPVNDVLSRADGRDKAARLVQYAVRLALGVLSRLSPSAARRQLALTFAKVMSTLSDARRTHRWLKLAPLLALRSGSPLWSEPSPAGRLLGMASQLSTVVFLGFDHRRWLQQHGLVSGSAARSGRYAMRLLAFTHACNALLALSKLRPRLASQQQQRQQQDGAAQEAVETEEERRRADGLIWREGGKQLLCMLQAGHNGQVPGLQTDDALVGAMGVLTASSDLAAIWRGVRRTR